MPTKNKTVVNINVTINYNSAPQEQPKQNEPNKWIQRLEKILKWFGL